MSRVPSPEEISKAELFASNLVETDAHTYMLGFAEQLQNLVKLTESSKEFSAASVKFSAKVKALEDRVATGFAGSNRKAFLKEIGELNQEQFDLSFMPSQLTNNFKNATALFKELFSRYKSVCEQGRSDISYPSDPWAGLGDDFIARKYIEICQPNIEKYRAWEDPASRLGQVDQAEVLIKAREDLKPYRLNRSTLLTLKSFDESQKLALRSLAYLLISEFKIEVEELENASQRLQKLKSL